MAEEPVPQAVDPEVPPAAADAPAVPAETVETVPLKTTSGSSTSVTPAPGEIAALSDEQKAVQGAATAQAAVAPAQAELAERQAEGAMSQADQFQADIAEREAKEAEHEKQIQAARALAAKAEDDVAGHHFHDLFEGEGTGHHILRIAAAALGGFGAGLVGGPNQAVEIMNRQVDRDFDRQRANLATKEKVAEWRRQGVTDLVGEQQRALASLEIKQAKAHDAIAQQSIAIQTRAGVPVEAAKNNVLVQQQLAQAAGLRAQALQRFEKHHGYTSTTHEVQVKTPTVATAEQVKALEDARAGGADRGKLLAIAATNRIPHALETVDKVLNGPGGANSSRIGLQEDRNLRQDIGQWGQQSNLNKAIVSRDKLLDLREKLSAKNPDPVTVAAALMEFDSAARNGTATASSFATMTGHLGGTWDQIKGKIEHGATGNISSSQLAILRKAVGRAIESSDEEGKRLHESYKDRFYSDPALQNKRSTIASEGDALFGRWGYTSDPKKERTGTDLARSIANAKTPEERMKAVEEAARSTSRGTAAVPTPRSTTPRPSPATAPRPAVPSPAALAPNDQAAIAWATAHPGDPRAVAIKQAHGM